MNDYNLHQEIANLFNFLIFISLVPLSHLVSYDYVAKKKT